MIWGFCLGVGFCSLIAVVGYVAFAAGQDSVNKKQPIYDKEPGYGN